MLDDNCGNTAQTSRQGCVIEIIFPRNHMLLGTQKNRLNELVLLLSAQQTSDELGNYYNFTPKSFESPKKRGAFLC